MQATRFLLSFARRSWIASALCVVVCAGFAARATAHVFEAEYLAEPTAVPPPAAPVVSPTPAVEDAGKANGLVDRNVFCSDCPASPGAGDPSPLPEIQARSSLILVATSLGDRPKDSYATLVDATTGAQGAYWLGQRVSGIGTLDKIAGTYVLVRNDVGAIERVELGRTAPVAAAPAPAKVATAAATPAAPAPDWAARVNKLDENTYEVDRSLIKDLMNAGAKLPGVRVTPALTKDGKLQGVRVAQARKDSLAAGIGLRAGDIVQAIDGTALDSTDAVLEMYGHLDSASVARVSLQRNGKPMELEYHLR